MAPRFLQIHTLTSYPASLLNRDDVGFAKRIPFGGKERTRISSQCLKRHWRTADDENALGRIRAGEGAVPMAVRSRRTFEKYLRDPLVAEGVSAEVAEALTRKVLETLLPEGKKHRAAKGKEKASESEPQREDLRTDQVTVLGRPEMDYLLELARQAAEGAAGAEAAVKAFSGFDKGELKRNLQALVRGAGLDAALFGRMTTGDVLARCDAAVHVAHAFTVHEGQPETDYFSAIDELQPREETGSGHINTAELTTGLYYGYVVIDLPLLVSNLEACERGDWLAADRTLAAEVVRRLIHLIATVSPGAKLGATAPYAHASMVLIEAGSRQPRTLANAFLDSVALRDGAPDHGGFVGRSFDQLGRYLAGYDEMYGREGARRLAAIDPPELLLARVDGRLDLPALARWAAETVEKAA
jgi:CRISPR system Cascade subunit CasC